MFTTPTLITISRQLGSGGAYIGQQLEKSDRERARYLQALTGRDWNDARLYHLAIDTMVGFEQAKEMILSYMKARFGEAAN